MYEREGRPLYYFRHAFISNRRNKGVTADVVALHSNTSVAMINKHYQDMSDDNLVKIHNQLFPERTMYLSKKSDYMLLIDWARKTERPSKIV